MGTLINLQIHKILAKNRTSSLASRVKAMATNKSPLRHIEVFAMASINAILNGDPLSQKYFLKPADCLHSYR